MQKRLAGPNAQLYTQKPLAGPNAQLYTQFCFFVVVDACRSGQLLSWAIREWCMKKEMTSHLSPEVNVDVSLFVSTCPFGLPRSGGEKSFPSDQKKSVLQRVVSQILCRANIFLGNFQVCKPFSMTGRWLIQIRCWTVGWNMFSTVTCTGRLEHYCMRAQMRKMHLCCCRF